MENTQQEAQEETVVIPHASGFMRLMQDLHKALDDAHHLITQYNQRLNAIKEREGQVEDRVKILNTLKDSLGEREAACQKVENILELHKKALEMEKDYNEKLAGLNEAIAHHNRDKESWKRQQAEERAEAKKETDNAMRMKKNIEQEVAKRVHETLVKMGVVKEEEQAAA